MASPGSGYKAPIQRISCSVLAYSGNSPLSVLERAPMSDRKLLMPKATAVWLVENTSLTFEQIAELCELHVLEVKGIADGDVAQGIKGMDPISTGQLTREEIARGEEDHDYRLQAGGGQGRHPRGQDQEGPALHAGVAAPGSAQRRALAAAQPSRAQGQPDHAPGRHHQADHCRHPRAHALELAQPAAPGPRDARPVHADRSRQRGQEGGAARGARAQGAGQAAAGESRHAAAGLADHTRAWGRSRTWRSWRPSPSRRSPRRPSARRRRACSPSLREMGGTKTEEKPE